MNKYKIIGLVVLSLLLIGVSILLHFEIKWWHVLIVYALGSYLGNVLNSTFKGFNIMNLNYKDSIDETRQVFTCDIVIGFKGKLNRFTGEFNKSIEISEGALRTLLVANTRRNEIEDSLKKNQKITKLYRHRGENIEIIFTEMTLINNF
jgi:hypothetical protein